MLFRSLAQLRNEMQPSGWERVAIRPVAPSCKVGTLACQLEAIQSVKGSSRVSAPALAE